MPSSRSSSNSSVAPSGTSTPLPDAPFPPNPPLNNTSSRTSFSNDAPSIISTEHHISTVTTPNVTLSMSPKLHSQIIQQSPVQKSRVIQSTVPTDLTLSAAARQPHHHHHHHSSDRTTNIEELIEKVSHLGPVSDGTRSGRHSVSYECRAEHTSKLRTQALATYRYRSAAYRYRSAAYRTAMLPPSLTLYSPAPTLQWPHTSHRRLHHSPRQPPSARPLVQVLYRDGRARVQPTRR